MSSVKNCARPSYLPKPLALIVCEAGEEWENYARSLASALEKHFRTAAPLTNGCDIWRSIFDEMPGVIIVSNGIKDMDAISLIRSVKASRFSFDTCFFLCCERLTDSVLSVVEHNGIDGAIERGAPVSEAAERIRKVYAESEKRKDGIKTLRNYIDDSAFFSDPELERTICADLAKNVLEPLRFNKAHIGTAYIELVIIMLMLGVDADLKTVYSLVAEHYKTNAAAVERSIRYSIEQAWKKSRPYTQFYLFGNTVDAEKGKPTNKEFIYTVVRHTSERIARGAAYDPLHVGGE